MFPHRKKAAFCLAIFLASFAQDVTAQYLPPSVLQAAEAARQNKATRGQRALLFKYNDDINKARLNGWIPDSTYQAAQAEYSHLNQEFAKLAAESTGAEFTVQQTTSQTYSPGTDSDYIVTTNSGDPVGQIQDMQSRYNDHVNSYLDEALASEGFEHTPRDNWHNQLDVDFMADPAHVTDEQFRQVAELNNDAYTRRGAAEYERRSRMGGVEVTPDQFADYSSEMQDFIKNKQDKMRKLTKDPAALTDPKNIAEHHRLMAQEQKYISRIESADELLRKQEGLPPRAKPKGQPYYEILDNGKGQKIIRKREFGTVAARGAKRSPTNRRMTGKASSVGQNSMQRAVTDLTESMTEAAIKNPKKWPNAQAQIAQMTDTLPPAAKGQVIQRVAAVRERAALNQILSEAGDLDDAGMKAARAKARRIGNEYSRGVAQEMQARARKPSLSVRADNKLRGMLGVTDDAADIAKMRGLRGTLNRRAASVMGGMERVGMLGTALEVAGAANSAYSAYSNFSAARGADVSAAQMREMHRQAFNDLAQLGSQGLMAGISYAMPTAGAIIGGYDMGYAAGRYVLENTAWGRAADAMALEGFDTAFQAWEDFWDRATNQRAGKLAAEAERRRKLEEAYWRALREGRIRMRSGVTITEFLERLRADDLAGVRELFEPGPNASQATIERFTAKPERKSKDPNDDLEWISQTFESEEDKQARDDYHRLVAEGKSPIGPVVNPDKEEGLVADTKPSRSAQPDYRARAEQFVRNNSRKAPSIKQPNYRSQAEQIHARVVAIEQERERQARIAEAQRLERLRQQQIAAERRRQQQIAAQQARARQAYANEMYRRQRAAQQAARQQAAWNAYWQTQQAIQNWARAQQANNYRQTYTPNTYGGGYSRGSNYNGSEADYYDGEKNPIYWGKQ